MSTSEATFWRAALMAFAERRSLGDEAVAAITAMDDVEVVEAGKAMATAMLDPVAEMVGRFVRAAVRAYRSEQR